MTCGFVIARREAAKALEVMEEDLDKVPLAVEFAVEPTFLLSRGIAADYGLDPFTAKLLDDSVGIVSCISKEGLPLSLLN